MRTPLIILTLALGSTLYAWSPTAPLAPTFPEVTVTSAPLPADPAIQQSELRLTLDGTRRRLPRLAIPRFLTPGGDATVEEAATTMAEVLFKDIEFEREFQMISGPTAAMIPPAPAASLPYTMWNEAGADEVLVGSVQVTDEVVMVEVRVMSVERKSSTFGKRYNCSTTGLRLCAHTIADELHKARFGLDGVARTKLAFTSDRDAERLGGTIEQRSVKEIYIADYDGFSQRRVTVRGSLNLAPAWAPDARSITYQSHLSGFVDIYVQKLYEIGLSRPAKGTDLSQNFLPKFSPDGTRLVFASSREGNWEIYTLNVDGTDLRRLTAHQADDGAPTWSPDGTKIAFTSDRSGSNQIYIMSADGGPVERVTREARKADRPTWAMDYIAFSAEVPGGTEIKKVMLGSKQTIQLTEGPGSNESPTVAPNGRHIAFVTTRWGKEQIAIMDADGQNVRRITTAGNNRYPAWSRR